MTEAKVCPVCLAHSEPNVPYCRQCLSIFPGESPQRAAEFAESDNFEEFDEIGDEFLEEDNDFADLEEGDFCFEATEVMDEEVAEVIVELFNRVVQDGFGAGLGRRRSAFLDCLQ